MDEELFRDFLKKKGKKKSAVDSIVEIVSEYESILTKDGIVVESAQPEDLEQFVMWVEGELGEKANRRLWGITAFYDFLERTEMVKHAGLLRGKRIKLTPFPLAKFRGVNQDYTGRLEQIGIKNVEQMIERGNTPEKRKAIAEKSNVPLESILELVKLADLTRIGAIRTVRARLYHDAGVDTIEKMARYDPVELRTYLQEWIEQSGFAGIAPLPKEAANAVETAKKLPRLVEYD